MKTVNVNNNEMFNYKRLLELYDFNLFVVVETWLDSNIKDGDLHVDGFRNFRKDRIGKGGGILLTVSDDIHCTRRFDL